MAHGKKRATLVDVAKLAGVSPKSVSRVFNNEPHISSALRQRVLRAAEQLDYRPNVMARALVRRRSFLIGLVYEKPSPSYVVELQRGALDRLHGEPYRLIVLPVESVADHPVQVVDTIRSAGLDGVILAPPAADHPDVLDGLLQSHIPFARISPHSRRDEGLTTQMDDFAAAREMAQLVISRGHRRIAIIKGDPHHAASEQRLSAYRAAFEEAGIAFLPQLVEDGDFSFESGSAAARRLLSLQDPPTAILAQNDDMAVGAIAAARELGVAVPGALSVAGFDDSEVARVCWPRLTTVRQPVTEMAHAAMDMLIRHLSGEDPGPTVVHRHALIEGASVGPPLLGTH